MEEIEKCTHKFTHEQFVKCMSNEKFKNFILEEVQPYIEEYERKKTELDKKHDKIFKNILSNKKEAVRLINKKFYLDIKPENIELYDKEFRQKGGKVLEADIIYKLKGSKTFFLIEQQTRNDYHMPFRVLNYDIEIMRTCEAKLKDEKEATVLAIVIHTGADSWKAKRSIREEQEDIFGKGTKKTFDIQTLGSYVLEDVNMYTKEKLLESEWLLDKAMYLEKAKDVDDFIECSREVFKRIKKEDYKIMNEVVRITLSGKILSKNIEELIKELNKGGGREMLAIKERIDEQFKKQRDEGLRIGREEGEERGLNLGQRIGRKEGREEGRKEGRKEGREEGRKEGRKEGREEGREEGKKERKKKWII